MSTAELKRLAHSESWDERYAGVDPDKQVYEWFRSFNDLSPFFARHLFQPRPAEIATKILHLGSGDSTIPEELSKLGYKDQVCVDFSTVVVQTMSLKHENIGGITWLHADVRNIDQIASGSIDIAFDKATLDAMIHGSPWNPPDEVLDNTGRYIREIFRVLKPDGAFLYVTYRQPHFIRPLLNCKGVNWDLEVETLGGPGSCLYYSGFLLKKAVPLVESKQAEIAEGASS